MVPPGSCLSQNSCGGRRQGGLHSLGCLRAGRGSSALVSRLSPRPPGPPLCGTALYPSGACRCRARKTWLARLKKRDSGVCRGPVILGLGIFVDVCLGTVLGIWCGVVCRPHGHWGPGQCPVPHSRAHAATGPSLLSLSSQGPGGSNFPASEELSGGAPRGSATCQSRMQTLPGWSKGLELHL